MAAYMASSDFFVLRVLAEVGEQRVTYKQIAERCEVQYTLPTVWRSLKRLQDEKKVKRLNRSKAGCVYEILDGAYAKSV